MPKNSDRPSPAELEKKRKFDLQTSGPPPDLDKRRLIFDSLVAIIDRKFGQNRDRNRDHLTNKGISSCVFTWGAGYDGQLGISLLTDHQASDGTG
jgi:hypothetical protein